SLYAGIWYEITSSAAGKALRIVLRTRLSTTCASFGFEAMYSLTDLKSVLAIWTLYSTSINQLIAFGSSALLTVKQYRTFAWCPPLQVLELPLGVLLPALPGIWMVWNKSPRIFVRVLGGVSRAMSRAVVSVSLLRLIWFT